MTPKMKATLDEEIREAARKLFLSSSVADLCKNEATPKQEEFLLHVFQAELAAREENKWHRLMKRTGFPTYKTFEGYEYGHIQFSPLFSREELESCQFIREHKNLILYGPVGTGKTHLAIAIGVKACQMGLKTKFFSVTELVLKLAEARKQGTLEKLVKDLQKQDGMTDQTYASILTQRGEEKLAERRRAESFECKTIANSNFRYKTDYDLGDVVVVRKEFWGVSSNLRITELTPNLIPLDPEAYAGHYAGGYVYPEFRGEVYSDFIADTVIPYVDSHYNTNSTRGIAGSSCGGQAAFYIGMENMDKFSYIGAFSSAFAYFPPEIWDKYLSSKDFSGDVPFVYLYTGMNKDDSTEQWIYPTAVLMDGWLTEHNYPADKKVNIMDADARHHESFWAIYMPEMLCKGLGL